MCRGWKFSALTKRSVEKSRKIAPDSMSTSGQRWLKVVSSVGPTLDANVGPMSLCSSGERSANMLGQRWPNVASFFPTTFYQRYANICGLL